MTARAGTFGLGDAMIGIALLALVLASARVNLPLSVAVAAVLGIAGHRVHALRRRDCEVGQALGMGRLVAVWAGSIGCAILLVSCTALAGFLMGFAGMVLGSLVFQVIVMLSRDLAGPLVGLISIVFVLLALGVMAWMAGLIRFAAWPGPDGRVRWEFPPPREPKMMARDADQDVLL